MVCHIETNREPDGGWIAKVPALPGLQVYRYSEHEALATARKLTAMLLQAGASTRKNNHRILAFYPGRIPASAHRQA